MNAQEQQPVKGETAISRRRFLGVTASVAGGALFRSAAAGASGRALATYGNAAVSAVVEVRSNRVVEARTVHPALPGEMLEKALTTLTGKGSGAEAWHEILKADDVVGLKFNRSGQQVIGTTEAMAEAVVTSLVESGWRSDQIICIEAPKGVADRLETARPLAGYDSTPSHFASGTDQLALVLSQVTALIDIPYLKTHHIAGLTCAMKNLSHGLIKHPARFHKNGCAPYIADIVGLPQIRDKLRLCLVDALRVVFAGGPEATARTISDEGVLLASRDPVATDTVALGLLNDVRKQQRLPPIEAPNGMLGYLTMATRQGLGVSAAHRIDLARVAP